jgi:predicted nucleotidyltransferase
MSLGPLRIALLEAVELLRDSGRSGAFIGGLGVIVWGTPRMTQDLDLLLDLPTAEAAAFLALASERGYSFDADEAALLSQDRGGFLRLLHHDHRQIPLDLLVADSPLQQEALTRARRVVLAGEEVPLISGEDLVLLKLVAFRPKDTFDIESVVDALADSLDRAYLDRWASRLGLEARLAAMLGDDDG